MCPGSEHIQVSVPVLEVSGSYLKTVTPICTGSDLISGSENPSSPSAPAEEPLTYILIGSTISSWNFPVLSTAARAGSASKAHSAEGES